MTAEPPRSSSSLADSYVGSLISLTSKSEIRYEGILISVNTEESSIALRNVRSFGTEGRKKDGPQVPPSGKIYEYILFRGSDIKDLQVKSSPPVQSTMPVPNDPAIIQSHYPQAPITSTSLPSSGSGSGSVQDPSVQTSQMGLPRPAFQGNLPLYQPSGNLASWGPTQPPAPANNVSGLAMPMYWQGMYGTSNGLQPQAQQHPLLRPPPGLSMSPMQQQTMHYPPPASFPNLASNLSTSKLSESSSPLLPPFSMGTPNLPSSMLATQSPTLASDSSASLIPNKSSTQTLPPAPLATSLPLASSLSSVLDKSAIPTSVSDKSKTIAGPVLPHLGVSETMASLAGTSTSYLNEGPMPSLVTPGQLLQSAPTVLNTSQPSLTAQKDVEVVQVSSPELTPPSMPAETRIQEPILPLPPPSERKIHGASSQNHYMHRGGRERNRGNRVVRPVTRFTEDFDFTAMNEKFNKDEVWGDLGKSSRGLEDGDINDEDENGSPQNEAKPVYVKDDFFDSLSCDSLDHGSRNGRTRFSEQLKKDSETFGFMPRHRGGRGGRGPGYGGRNRGGYHGRGYGYGGRGRGRGHAYSNHAV